jgi:glyoxylase-like metal-dependent hydrolase (beta-lactamase superfamily II)
MDALFDNLYSVAPERLSFAPDYQGRAFLLARPQGNILIYSSGHVAGDFAALAKAGGVARQYLNHEHQANASCDEVAAQFGAPLYCHAADAEAAARTCNVAQTFDSRSHHFDDFEAIPIPGHTPGSTAFLWTNGRRRYLFTGDTVYLRDGKWRIAVLDGISDPQLYREALALIRGLDFDVLVPSMAKGEPFQNVSADERHTRIDELIARIDAGDY